MSVLAQVHAALKRHSNIEIVGICDENHLPHRRDSWSQTIDYIVAPRRGVYDEAKLQTMMMALTPGLRPSAMDEFTEVNGEIRVGKLYFDEEIGTEVIRRELLLSDSDLFSYEGFEGGKQIIEETKPLTRRTWVTLYPNVPIAAAVFRGDLSYFRIPKSEIDKYRGVLATFRDTLF